MTVTVEEGSSTKGGEAPVGEFVDACDRRKVTRVSPILAGGKRRVQSGLSGVWLSSVGALRSYITKAGADPTPSS